MAQSSTSSNAPARRQMTEKRELPGEVVEAPAGHPRYGRRRWRIVAGERLPFPLVPHHAAEVGARHASARDAMKDHEVGIVDDRTARLEHTPHDIYVFLTVAPAAHRSQRDIEAAQGEERRAPVHHIASPHLGMTSRGDR